MLADHPAVKKHHATQASISAPTRLDAETLRAQLLAAGADDVGFVPLSRPGLDDQREDILKAFPRTKTLISFVVRMNREPIRTPARSIANLEFHHTGEAVDGVSREIVRRLEHQGVRALNPAMGFPMEMEAFPGKIWVVSHKPVAVEAGLGMMGIHRNVIHPQFGNFILLGTILLDAEVSHYGSPIDFNPCLSCKLCVAACPVGAIAPDGEFNFSACYTHNYREFMGGFTDWTEEVADSKTRFDYRSRVDDTESVSMWQSLSFGANYKAAYCLSVCPAGDEVIGPFLDDKRAHLTEMVKPLQDKEETIYVLENSDAEEHVAKRFPRKRTKRVGNTLRPRTLEGFLRGAPLVFQPGKSRGLDAVYHFTFTGAERRQATFTIRDEQLSVQPGRQGDCVLHVTADVETWLGFLAHEKSFVWAILTGKIRLHGWPSWLLAFAKCFPA